MRAAASPRATPTTTAAASPRPPSAASYSYDALERLTFRTVQTVGGPVTTQFAYDISGQVLAEAASTVNEYIWLDDMPVAMLADAVGTSPQLYFLHTDHLDRPVMMTDGAKSTQAATAFRFRRHVIAPNTPRPVAKSGRAAGRGVGVNWKIPVKVARPNDELYCRTYSGLCTPCTITGASPLRMPNGDPNGFDGETGPPTRRAERPLRLSS
jgi:hypothetical protein